MVANKRGANNSFIREDMVAVNVTTSDWEDAVDIVGRIMVDAGFVQMRYVDAMKHTIKELGPYSVIAPGIAMPHARPEDGVLKSGFALITLATPVEFGSSQNDPVQIVIAFGAVDKEQHIESLAKIAKIFSDQSRVKEVIQADSKEQVLELLNVQSNPESTIKD